MDAAMITDIVQAVGIVASTVVSICSVLARYTTKAKDAGKVASKVLTIIDIFAFNNVGVVGKKK